MELPPVWSQTCVCGRTFFLPQAYTCHRRSCQRAKKRVSSAFQRVHEVWQTKKRRKMEQVTQSVEEMTQSQPVEDALDESGDVDEHHPPGGQNNG